MKTTISLLAILSGIIAAGLVMVSGVGQMAFAADQTSAGAATSTSWYRFIFNWFWRCISIDRTNTYHRYMLQHQAQEVPQLAVQVLLILQAELL